MVMEEDLIVDTVAHDPSMSSLSLVVAEEPAAVEGLADIKLMPHTFCLTSFHRSPIRLRLAEEDREEGAA